MTMDIFHRLLGHKPVPAPAARRLPARRHEVEIDIDADELPATCGWFDSSHELQAGLRVTEHNGNDAVAAQLPLADWLAIHLADWHPRAGAPAS